MLVAKYSYTEMLSAIERIPLGNDGGWGGGLSAKAKLDMARNGDNSTVAKCEALLDRIASASIETPRAEWLPSVCGAYPCVPDAIAGFPEPMRRMSYVPMETAPLRLVVSTTTGANHSAETLMNRGCAVMALLLKLQAIRQVELMVLCDQGGYNPDTSTLIAISLESSPLDISRAAYCLTHPGFCRGTLYPLNSAKHNGGGGWLQSVDGPPYVGYTKWVKEVLNLGPSDIHVPPLYNSDDMADPVKWVNDRLGEYLRTMEA